jgi:Yip1-like protein
MTVINPAPAGSSSLIARVQGILMTPRAEWDKIDAEPATPRGLFTGYACILAAIPAIAQVIGGLFPVCVLGVCVHRGLIGVIVGAIVYYILSLAAVFVTALIVDELAPSFGGQKNRIQALKVVVYSWTAFWLAGVFYVLPMLAWLSIIGLYSFYLMYLGLPKLMKSPQDRAVGYTAVSIILGVVIYFVAIAIAGSIAATAMFSGGGLVRNDISHVSGTVHVGGASVDLGQLDKAAAAMQAQAAGQPAPAGAVHAVPADTLKALLPVALPSGFARTEVSASSAGTAAVGGSNAQGVYTKGDGRITLEVTDLAAMGALAAMGGAINVQSNRETATGYEKVGKVDGRLTTERFDTQSKSGKYAVVVANRFVVDAEGSGVAIDDLKAAVSAVGIGKLEGMAHA